MGASEKLQTEAPWATASIFTILNLSHCHNRQRMSAASRTSNTLGGGGDGQVPRKFSCPMSNYLVSSPDKTYVDTYVKVATWTATRFPVSQGLLPMADYT